MTVNRESKGKTQFLAITTGFQGETPGMQCSTHHRLYRGNTCQDSDPLQALKGKHLPRLRTIHKVPGEIKRSRDQEEGGGAGPSS